eukprot:CAMPEP_0184862456 /NCGR_PEP_ID=MMETSP0580-20130426/6909_1 /TAXON_ID=1118495 /ORGANISM="Dactyliosolen fragilissimus" /LENGTH=1000 /DNA_ID=CAMNT_0027360327 /DNA_START=246 /DNA_END=3248 /DNA_ORIENTATION=-
MRNKNKSSATLMRKCGPKSIFTAVVALSVISSAVAKLADRGRMVKSREERSGATQRMDSRVYGTYTKPYDELPIEGPKYRGKQRWDAEISNSQRSYSQERSNLRDSSLNKIETSLPEGGKLGTLHLEHEQNQHTFAEDAERSLSSQLTGCCSTYSAYSSEYLCAMYGEACNTGQEPSHDSGDESCEMAGLSFIGVSFSVQTALGNPYSYQLCDQFPMENIIDRDYNYVMSMDEDGWLVGGGYKSFDYSGKMPYIDSSHTELLRIGSLDPDYGGTTIEQVYSAMSAIQFPPFSIFPEYVKGGGGHHSSDDGGGVPSGDVTLIVSVVETYLDDDNYSTYDRFLDNLFNAMDAVNGGPCMDDHDTDPHVSMSRGVKFKSSYHQSQYFFKANLEVAVWQAIYPKGVVIGSESYTNFPPEDARKNQEYVGYGNLYFFFDRANITKAFPPKAAQMTSNQEYYATYWNTYPDAVSDMYGSVTTINFDYSGSGSGNDKYYEHNPYGWSAKNARHDMTDGWDLPPNCEMEGETFFGIPLSRASSSKLQSTSSFQNQFDFEFLVDRNYTYMDSFGTNHGWLNGEILGNGPGSIVDKDTSHIPLFYTGTTNPDMGGISLSNLIKIGKDIDFGTLYIKPAFVFQDFDGSIKLQFEADSSSALAYLYDNLCKEIGLAWNYDKPENSLGIYSNCVQHAAGDRAAYGCGPDNGKSGGFCPQMTLAYRVSFQSEDAAAEFLARGNNYVDYWREIYPTGVAVGTSKFCSDGGCLGLFLNRYDLYQVFKPDKGGSWVEYNGGSFAPTISPAPTASGGCDNPHNKHLDKCFRKHHKQRASLAAWSSLGTVGQFSVFLIGFMAVTLSTSIFLARARTKRRRGETHLQFFMRDIQRGSKRRKKLRKKRKTKNKDLEEKMLNDDLGDENSTAPPPRKGKSARSSSKSRSSSATRSKSKSRSLSRETGNRRRSRSSSRARGDESGRGTSRSRSTRGKRERSESRAKKVKPEDKEKNSNRRQLV